MSSEFVNELSDEERDYLLNAPTGSTWLDSAIMEAWKKQDFAIFKIGYDPKAVKRFADNIKATPRT